MTYTQEQGLWNLMLQRYAGNCHILRNCDHGSLKHRAQLENDVIESFALDHFGLQEALERVRDFVDRRSDFPP